MSHALRWLLLAIPVVPSECAFADLMLTVTEGPGGTANLTIEGTGSFLNDFDDENFWFGTTTDTFLKPDSPFRFTDSPGITRNGKSSNTAFTYDNDGRFGVAAQSSLRINFVNQFPGATINLADLNGTYAMSGWLFSDFVPGSYSLTSIEPGDFRIYENVGDVTLRAIPEPSAFLFLGLVGGSLGFLRLANRRQTGRSQS